MDVGARLFACAFCVLVLTTGCRGNGGPSMVPSVTSGTASFSVEVPPAAPGIAAAQSLVITLNTVNGTAPRMPLADVKMNLTKSTPGCTADSGGTLTCTAKIGVPAGSDAFTVATYAQLNGQGQLVSSDHVTTQISAGRSTTCAKKTAAKS